MQPTVFIVVRGEPPQGLAEHLLIVGVRPRVGPPEELRRALIEEPIGVVVVALPRGSSSLEVVPLRAALHEHGSAARLVALKSDVNSVAPAVHRVIDEIVSLENGAQAAAERLAELAAGPRASQRYAPDHELAHPEDFDEVRTPTTNPSFELHAAARRTTPIPPSFDEAEVIDELERRLKEVAEQKPRVSVLPSQPVPQGTRIVLIDSDVTRADGLARQLRQDGVEVLLCSPERHLFNPRLIRRQSPHAIIVEEATALAPGSGLVADLRGDSFLKHTPLLILPLVRAFDHQTGEARTAALLARVVPLAQPESTLLDRLALGCEVELCLDELSPHLLLKLLASRSALTRMDCVRSGQSLTWLVGSGTAGSARLKEPGSESRILEPAQALEWLLEDGHSQIVLRGSEEHAAAQGVEVDRLVDERLDDVSMMIPLSEVLGGAATTLPGTKTPPPRYRSWQPTAPPPSSSQRPVTLSHAPTIPSQRALRSQASGRRSPREMLAWTAAGVATLTALFLSGGHLVAPLNAALAPPAAAMGGHTEGPQEPRPVDSPLARPSEQATPRGGAAIARASSGSTQLATTQESPDSASVDPSAATDSSTSKRLADVPPDPEFRGCSVKPASGPESAWPGLALQHLGLAQEHLMRGRDEDAHQALCRSAGYDPTGKGQRVLGLFYLRHRAFDLAQQSAEQVARGYPKDIEARLLLADVLHRAARHDEAQERFLAVLGVARDKAALRRSVSTKFLRYAERSLRAHDDFRGELYLRRAVALWPGNAVAALRLGQVLARAGHDEAAKLWIAHAKQHQ